MSSVLHIQIIMHVETLSGMPFHWIDIKQHVFNGRQQSQILYA